MLTLVLGGARSGKSRHAEQLAMQGPPPWTYVATGQAWDQEMHDRIAAHRAARPPGWITVEAPIDLAPVLAQPGVVLVDCLTLWLTNLMLAEDDVDVDAATTRLETALDRTDPTILVSNEVGLGIVPETPLGRRFRDAAGLLHQRLAARARRVILVVAGLPLIVK